MLGRMADNMYWMARYIERSENAARYLESAYQTSLMPTGPGQKSEWDLIFDALPDQKGFLERYSAVSPGTVASHLVLNRDNPTSILSCIWYARENARATRHMLTTDLWGAINQTWLEIKDLTYNDILDAGLADFADWAKQRSNLVRGVAHGTMRRDEGVLFIRLGTYLERADNTARLLRNTLERLGKDKGRGIGAEDYYRWGALLKGVSALKTYREFYGGGIDARSVLELMIFREEMPRSLHSCLSEVVSILEQMRPRAECARLAGRLHADLHYGGIEDLDDLDLDEWLCNFMTANNTMAVQLQKDFMMIL